MSTNIKEQLRERLLRRQATNVANAANVAYANAANANAAFASATNATNTIAVNGKNATSMTATTPTTANAANANATSVHAANVDAANATPTTTTTKRGKLPKAPARKANAFDKLMNANNNQQGGNGDTMVKKATTIRGLLDTVTLDENRKCDDFERYLHRLHGRVVREITRALQVHRNIKVQLQIDAHYEKLKPKEQPQTGGARTRKQRREEEARERQQQEREEEEEVEGDNVVAAKRPPVTLVTQLTPILNARQVRGTVDKLIATLRERHINSLRDGSGMVMREIAVARILIARYEPLVGRRYAALPDFLAKKQAIVNVRNQDSRCFGYAILAAKLDLDHHEHADRPSKYDGRFHEYGLDRLTYPVQLDSLEEVERQLGIAFNVFSFFDDEGKGRYPLYLSRLDIDNAIDLLYLGHALRLDQELRMLHA